MTVTAVILSLVRILWETGIGSDVMKLRCLLNQIFVRECEAHKLPFHYTGTHRRVLLKALLDYKKGRDQARRVSIVRLLANLKNSGDYDKFIPPEE